MDTAVISTEMLQYLAKEEVIGRALNKVYSSAGFVLLVYETGITLKKQHQEKETAHYNTSFPAACTQ